MICKIVWTYNNIKLDIKKNLKYPWSFIEYIKDRLLDYWKFMKNYSNVFQSIISYILYTYFT